MAVSVHGVLLQCVQSMTALMKAAAGGHPDIVKMLLEAGADASYRRGHDTAFSLARDHKHEDVLALLRRVEEEHGRRMSTTAQAVRGSI